MKKNNDFLNRLRAVKTTRWIRFAIVSIIFFAWVIWLGNPWVALAWLLLVDIYITGYIPLGWWKNKGKTTRFVMGWVDAIVYALILVYFIFAFIGQNYQIPSSSLEKSLLVGDYLWVNKTVYGPRVPQTPLHFPLAQHTMPLIGGKSYLESPAFEYHRLPGLRDIKRGDIVVFNYPMGDTVALKYQNPDYYQIVYSMQKDGRIPDPRAYIRSNPEEFGEVIWRPVDRRENYVKRAIGLPGDMLRISNDSVFINGNYMTDPQNVQYNYIVPVTGVIPADYWHSLGVRLEDHKGVPYVRDDDGMLYYNVPLTHDMKTQLEKHPLVGGTIVLERQAIPASAAGVFPYGNEYGWDRSNFSSFWIPKRGATLHLTKENLPIYERAIRVYEGNDLRVDADGKIFINGKPSDYYTFKMDYYWMQGDNRDRSLDSRFWGFVPEDHIVGSPMFVIISLDAEKGLFDGKLRTNRILKDANPEAGKWN